jgi:hypothetical protein
MYRGKTNRIAKVWRVPFTDQFDEIQSGVSVEGNAPAPDGSVLLTSPVNGYTKKIFLSDYKEVIVSSPPPPTGVKVTSVTVHYTEDGVEKTETIP